MKLLNQSITFCYTLIFLLYAKKIPKTIDIRVILGILI